MKAAKKPAWMFRLKLDLAEEIHPEDAATAILTRIFSSRPKSTTKLKRAVQDTLLDSMANNPWSADQLKCVEALSKDADFRERFGRAFGQGRQPTFDKIDELILRNWRTIHDIQEIKHMPGLRHWHPSAAAKLFTEYDESLSGSEEWFVKRRQRLGLKSIRPYRVKNFRQSRDGMFVVDLD